MKTFPITELYNFRKDQKFIWNDIIYTVFQHEKGMTEVYGNNRFWAWNSNAKVIPISQELH